MKPTGLPLCLFVAGATLGATAQAVAGGHVGSGSMGGMHAARAPASQASPMHTRAPFHAGWPPSYGHGYAATQGGSGHTTTRYASGPVQVGGWHTSTGPGLAPEPIFGHGDSGSFIHGRGPVQIGGWHTSTGHGLAPEPLSNGGYGGGQYGHGLGPVISGGWHTATGQGMTSGGYATSHGYGPAPVMPVAYHPAHSYGLGGYRPSRDRVSHGYGWAGSRPLRYSYGYGSGYGQPGIYQSYGSTPSYDYASNGSQSSGYQTSGSDTSYGHGSDSYQPLGYGTPTGYGEDYEDNPHDAYGDRFHRGRFHAEYCEQHRNRDRRHPSGGGWTYGDRRFDEHRRAHRSFFTEGGFHERTTYDHRSSADWRRSASWYRTPDGDRAD